MNINNKVVIFLLVILLTTSCSKDRESEHDKQIAALSKDVKSISENIKNLEKKLRKLEFDLVWKDALNESEKSVHLSPGEQSFSVVRFSMGYLTVAIKNVEQYANGTKVTFSLGNPLSANISGISMKFEYGSKDAEGGIDYNSQKSKKELFIETLRSGAWDNFTVILDGISPNKLDYIKMSEIDFTTISLLKAK